MSNKTIYYVYAYLRSKDSKTAKAGTPYYIGKGKGSRYRSSQHSCPVPTDHRYIVFLERRLTEFGAFALERRMIAWYGRKNNKTGMLLLLNLSDGGEGPAGVVHTEETRAKRSASLMGHSHTEETRAKMRKPKQYSHPAWNKGKKLPKHSDEVRLKRAKSLCRPTTVNDITYPSFGDAVKALNTSPWFLRKMLAEAQNIESKSRSQ